MVFVTWSSLYSFEGTDLSTFNIPNGDKLVHFTFYFVAAALGFLYLTEMPKGKVGFKTGLMSLIVSLMFFGIIIEVVQQAFTSNRSGDVFDALANSIGVICGVVVLYALFYEQRRLK